MSATGRKVIISDDDKKVGGFNVYRDDKGRPIYLNRMNHTGYVLTGKSKPFRTYSSRFFLGGIAAIFTYMFELPIPLCIAIGVIVYIVMEFKFRRFLSTLAQIPNFKPAAHSGRIEAESRLDTKKIVTKIILFVLLSVLLLVNAFIMEQYEGIILALNVIISIGVGIMAIIEIVAFSMHLKNKKQN